MLKGLLAVAAAALIVITGYEAWGYYIRVDQPPALLLTEDALATDDLVGLGSVSIQHAVRLEQAFLGAPDTEGAGQRGLLASTPFATFQSAGIDPRRDLSYLVFGLYLDADAKPGYALALLGRFDRAKLMSWLHSEYQVSPAPDGAPSVWQVRKQNVDTCSWSEPWSVYIGDSLLMVADPGRMPGLLDRVNRRAAALRELDRWRGFRDTKLGSLALFVPEQSPDTGNPFLQQPVQRTHDALDAFDEVYFGLGLWPLPFRAQLELMLAGADAVAVTSTASDWQAALQASRVQWGEQMPTVARLHDALSVSTEDSALRVNASVDQDWLADAARIPQELMTLLFSGAGMGMSIKDDPPAQREERIDENPSRYVSGVAPQGLAAYQPEPPFLPEADVVSGPFGIRLSAVELGAADGSLELTITGIHRGIPNLGEVGERVNLYIDSVSDAAGNELLRGESCGQERSDLAAQLDRPYFNDSLAGEKKVRLKPGLRHADIHRIQGRVELSLPVDIETIRLAALDTEQTIDREGIRVTLQASAADTLDYKVYGDPDRLLEVRGLNAAAQPLSGSSSMSSGFLFGEGQSKSRSFAGQVANAEVVIALRDVEQSYPFELDTRQPRASQAESRHEPVSVPTYSLAQLRREFPQPPALPADPKDILAQAVTGPFRVALGELRPFMGLYTGFTVYAPAIPALADNLSAVALQVTAIENAAGENLVAAPRTAPLRFSEDWQDRSRLQDQVQVEFETRIDTADIHKLKGQLQVRLPRQLRSLWIDTSEVGTSVSEADLQVTLSRVDDQGVTLDFGAWLPALVAVNAYNPEGHGIWVPHPQLEFKDGRWRGRFDTHGSAARIELVLAGEQEQHAFPFELAVARQE